MSVSRRSRRAAAVGIGALALVLTGGPALAAAPTADMPSAPAVGDAEQTVADTTATAEQAVAPAPAAPAPAPAPAAPQPAVVSPPAKKAPAAPVETVTTVVNTLVTVVLGQLEAKPARPPAAPVPPAGAPAVQSGTPPLDVLATAPAPPFRTPAVSAAVREANEAVEAIADAALSGNLGAFAREIAGDLPAGELALAGPSSSPLTLSQMLAPSVAGAETFQPIGSSGSRSAVPALLVAVAAVAVGLSAVGNGVEIRRRR